jgi:hypothetical protein
MKSYILENPKFLKPNRQYDFRKSQGAAQSTYQEPDTLTAAQRRIFRKASVGHMKVVRNAGYKLSTKTSGALFAPDVFLTFIRYS